MKHTSKSTRLMATGGGMDLEHPGNYRSGPPEESTGGASLLIVFETKVLRIVEGSGVAIHVVIK